MLSRIDAAGDFFNRLFRSATLSPGVRGIVVPTVVVPTVVAMAAMAAMVMTGCGKPASQNPGEWRQSQVESWLREQLKTTELSLSADGERAFKGTARDSAGTAYELKVTQSENKIQCEFTSSNGTGKGQGQFSYSASGTPPPR